MALSWGFKVKKRNAVLVALVVVIILIGGCGRGDTPEKFVQDARANLAANNYDRAREILQQGLFEHPSDRKLNIELASLYATLEQWPELLQFLRLSQMPESDKAHFYGELGRHELTKENWRAALRYFEDANHRLERNWHDELLSNLADMAIANTHLERFDRIPDIHVAMENIWANEMCTELSEQSMSMEMLVEVAPGMVRNRHAIDTVGNLVNAISEMEEDIRQGFQRCVAEAERRYFAQWAAACRSQARQLEQQITLCIETSRDMWTETRYGRRVAHADAERLCNARIGEIDASGDCRLTSERANRIEGARHIAVRECERRRDQ